MIKHPISPEFDKSSTVLILGSFPSVKSREQAFFYGHPQNRFWKVISAVFGKDVPSSVLEKKAFLRSVGVALWDVIAECEITGSSDTSIKNVKANDLSVVLRGSDIRKIFVNGKTALTYYDKLIKNKIGIEAICLPSTSPANASFSLERLIDAWQIINK